MSRSGRRWAWVGGVWLALVVAGGGATLLLQPGEAASGGSRGGTRVPSPLPSPASSDGDDCADERAEAQRKAQREGAKGFAVLCIKGPVGSDGPLAR